MNLNQYYEERFLGDHLAITLHKPLTFMPMAFQVMSNDVKDVFLPCIPLKVNGNVRLLYRPGGYMGMKDALAVLDDQKLPELLLRTFAKINDFTAYGFLDGAFLLLDLPSIFVDRQTLDVRYVYVPARMEENTGRGPENDLALGSLRAAFAARLYRAHPDPGISDRIRGCLDILEHGQGSAAQLTRDLENAVSFQQKRGPEHPRSHLGPVSQKLVLQDARTGRIIRVSRDGLMIGRSSPSPQGRITEDPALGRRQCQILHEDGQYCLMDLRSTNGTFVNGKAIPPMKAFPIHPGDRISMARQVFYVRYENDES